MKRREEGIVGKAARGVNAAEGWKQKCPVLLPGDVDRN
jgi:hypothetical protein